MTRNRTALVALAFSGLSLAGCGSKQGYAADNSNSTQAADTSSMTTTQRPVADSTATTAKHHSVLAGALAGAAAGHVAGHHALAGAAVGALVQHERNKHPSY